MSRLIWLIRTRIRWITLWLVSTYLLGLTVRDERELGLMHLPVTGRHVAHIIEWIALGCRGLGSLELREKVADITEAAVAQGYRDKALGAIVLRSAGDAGAIWAGKLFHFCQEVLEDFIIGFHDRYSFPSLTQLYQSFAVRQMPHHLALQSRQMTVLRVPSPCPRSCRFLLLQNLQEVLSSVTSGASGVTLIFQIIQGWGYP